MLQQSDIDALIVALASSQESGKSRGTRGNRAFDEVRIYDFERPDNLPSEFLKALESINASMARMLAGLLTGQLSMGVQVETLDSDQMTYRQFCHSVPEVTTLAVVQIPPLDGILIFEMNPHIAHYLLDCGLGGTGEQIDAPREFTMLERGLLDDLFRRILRELSRSWEMLLPIHPNIREILHNPMIVRGIQPDDRMVVSSFSIAMGEINGMCNYAIPINSLDFERLLNRDIQWDVEKDDTRLERELAQLPQTVLEAGVVLRACLPEQSLSVEELISLQEGDILYFHHRVDDPIEVRVENQLRFTAYPLSIDEKFAIQLEQRVEE